MVFRKCFGRNGERYNDSTKVKIFTGEFFKREKSDH